jgi:antitoxin (DNA-binding transcriptional repressor) of toxin-antitoxin stability system
MLFAGFQGLTFDIVRRIVKQMKTATVRKVQHHFNEVLAWVADGETVTVTRHKETVAQIVPVRRKSKKVTWPDFAARLKRIYPQGVPRGKPAGEIIEEMREERF